MKSPWHRLREDKESALLEIYKSYYRDLYNYGIRIAKDHEVTRDCIHDLFEDLLIKTSLDKISDPKPYLLKSLRYIIIDALKKLNKQKLIHEDQYPDMMLSKEDILISKEHNEETSIKIFNALSTLGPRQKEVVYLRFYSGLSYQDITEVTGIQYQSIRNLLSTAIIALRKQMLPIMLISSLVQL